MTNAEKQELRQLARQGLSFEEIRELVDCSDSTIRRYIKAFAQPPTTDNQRTPAKIAGVVDNQASELDETGKWIEDLLFDVATHHRNIAEAKAAIQALLREARIEARLQLRDELLSLGHGGGNWRRLIMSVGRPVALRKQSKGAV